MSIRRAYLAFFTLLIAVMLGIFLTTWNNKSSLEKNSELLNTLARGRTLASQIASEMQAARLQAIPGYTADLETAKKDAQESAQTFESLILPLLPANRHSSKAEAKAFAQEINLPGNTSEILESIDRQWRKVSSTLPKVLENRDEALLIETLASLKSLNASLDIVYSILLKDAKEKESALLKPIIWGSLIIILLCLAAWLFISKRFFNSLEQLKASSAAVAKGLLPAMISKPDSPKELQELGNVINTALGTLFERLNVQNAILDSLSDAIILTDAKSKIVYANDGMGRMLSLSAEKVIGLDAAEILNRLGCSGANPFARGASSGALVLCHGIGGEAYLRIQTSMARDNAGQTLGQVGIIADVTESAKKQTQTRDRVSQLYSLNSEINETTLILAQTTEEIAKQLGEISKTAYLQRQQIKETSDTIRRLLSFTQEISEQAQNIANTALNVQKQASEGSKISQESSRSAVLINHRIEVLNTSMNEMNKMSNDIGWVNEFIADLSEQLTKLAFLAATEVVRAGEAGNDFAPISEQARKLSEVVSNTVQNTSKILENLRTGLNKSEKDMLESMRMVTELTELGGRIGILFTDTSEGSRNVASQSERMNENIFRQDNLAAEIDQKLDSIGQASDAVTRYMSEIAEAAVSLSTLARSLRNAYASEEGN